MPATHSQPEYNLAEELYNKTFETLRHLVSSVKLGKITEEQFSTAIDTLFMAVCGLVPDYADRPKFIDVVTACQEEAKNCYPIVRRCFHNPQSGVFKLLSWQAGDSHLTINIIGGPSPGKRRMDYETPEIARDKLAIAGAPGTLAKLGYVEL